MSTFWNRKRLERLRTMVRDGATLDDLRSDVLLGEASEQGLKNMLTRLELTACEPHASSVCGNCIFIFGPVLCSQLRERRANRNHLISDREMHQLVLPISPADERTLVAALGG
jgi:hypothetical protein